MISLTCSSLVAIKTQTSRWPHTEETHKSRKSKQVREQREQSEGFLRPTSRGRKAMWASNVFNGYLVFFTCINKRIPPPPKRTSSRRGTGEKPLLPCTICKSLLAVALWMPLAVTCEVTVPWAVLTAEWLQKLPCLSEVSSFFLPLISSPYHLVCHQNSRKSLFSSF